MKLLAFFVFLLSLFLLSDAMAQQTCPSHQIYGVWKYAGTIPAEYSHPPALVNADSIKKNFVLPDLGTTWNFYPDSTVQFKTPLDSSKKRFSVRQKDCALLLPGRKRNPLYIMYLDESCLVVWHNNPQRAALTVFRR
jgi:hypothetical protein